MRRLVPLYVLVALGLSSCIVQLISFEVPPAVRAGRPFEVVVTGTARSEGLGSEPCAAVLQIPNGFAVLSAGSNHASATLRRDDAALLALYTPEPGHYLAGFSGQLSTGGSNPVVLRVLLHAPLAQGPYTFKVALAGVRAGGFVAQVPAGVGSFAQITAAPHSQPITVGTRPPAEFSIAPAGLRWHSTAGWSGVTFGDVNRDGRDDVAGIARLGDGPHVFLAQPGGTWSESSSGLPGSSGRSNVAFGDFNGDGWLDLGDGNGSAFLGNGGSSWTRSNNGIAIRGGGMEGVAVGDVNGDGFDDVAFAGHFSGYVQVFLSNGAGAWTEASAGLPNQTQGSIDGGHKLMLRDVTGDGFVDVVWTRYYAPNVWAGDGRGNWTPGTGLGPHQFWGAGSGDLDGDGVLELVFGTFDLGSGQGGGGVQVYGRTGANAWALRGNTGLPATGLVQDVALADFDRDGNLDVVFGAYGVNVGLSLYRGAGDGTFAPWTGSGLPAAGLTNVEGLAAGDVDGDTFPDVGAAVYGLGLVVWRNDRTGFSRYDASCRGALGTAPQIGFAGGDPRLGNSSFVWTAAAGPANAPAALWLGASKTFLNGLPVLPLDLSLIGAPTCRLVAAPEVVLPTALNGSGAGHLAMPIPATPSLFQATVFGQWGTLAPAANPLGLVFTGGAAARIGG
jgi:hypothetical protein